MNKIDKYRGVIPAFYACYDDNGEVSPERIRTLTDHLIAKGVNGLYVGGSSGECIYQSVSDRKTTLENVIAAAQGRVTIIAHVACNNTKDSVELAKHAESLGADAIAAIPPIYFHLPEHAIAKYWNEISQAAPNTDFIIYNIPQLAGVSLTKSLLQEMLKNPKVIAVKNSSMPVQDIQTFKAIGGDNFIVFNGPDEQFAGGYLLGADGGIGGTYAVMPELFIKLYNLLEAGNINSATKLQFSINAIIEKMCSCHGNLYAVMKHIIFLREGIKLGSVRTPLPELIEADMQTVEEAAEMISKAIKNI